MRLFTNRVTRFILLPLLGASAAVVFFNAYYYKTSLGGAVDALADIAAGRLERDLFGEHAPDRAEAALLSNGLEELVEPVSGDRLALAHVTVAGAAFDGSPTYNTYYKGDWQGAKLTAFWSEGRLQLKGVCDLGVAGCRFNRVVRAPEGPVVDAVGPAPGRFGLMADASRTTVTRENHRAGVEPAVPVNRPPGEAALVGQQVLVNRGDGAKPKGRPAAKLLGEAPPAESDPFANLKIPVQVHPWLGTWSGGGMSFNINFTGGKLRVGKYPARLNGPELTCLRESEFGRPVWVKMSFSDGLLFAKEESQYGEVIQSAVLSR